MSALTKIERVLNYLATGQTINHFEAESRLHDHCLNSTIAKIKARGIPVYRHMERVKGYRGHPTRVARYWIAAQADRDRAREVLKAMANARDRKPAVGAAGSQCNADTARGPHVSCEA